MLYLVIFFIILILTVILITLKINFVIEYAGESKEDKVVLTVFVLKGIIKKKFEIPLDEKEGFKLRKIKKKEKPEKDERKKKEGLNITEVKGKIEKAICNYKNNRLLIKNIICYLKKKLIFKEVKLTANIGTGDAACTAMLYALAWTVAGIGFSYIYNNFKVEKHYINIKENFMEKIFNIDLYCIFTVKLVHIIIVALKSIIQMKKQRRIKHANRWLHDFLPISKKYRW